MLFGKEGWLGLVGTVLKLFYASPLLSLAWEVIQGRIVYINHQLNGCSIHNGIQDTEEQLR